MIFIISCKQEKCKICKNMKLIFSPKIWYLEWHLIFDIDKFYNMNNDLEYLNSLIKTFNDFIKHNLNSIVVLNLALNDSHGSSLKSTLESLSSIYVYIYHIITIATGSSLLGVPK